MKVDRLDCFVQVAKTLNFSKSAEVLHLSQPSISRIIHLLEQELGFDLFERNRNQVVLMPVSFYVNTRRRLRKPARPVRPDFRSKSALLVLRRPG